MKTKLSVITGNNDSEVIAVVEGRATPHINALLEKFYETYGFPDYTKARAINEPYDLMKSANNIEQYYKAVRVAHEAGLNSTAFGKAGASGQFVQWLVKFHDYKIIDANITHIP